MSGNEVRVEFKSLGAVALDEYVRFGEWVSSFGFGLDLCVGGGGVERSRRGCGLCKRGMDEGDGVEDTLKFVLVCGLRFAMDLRQYMGWIRMEWKSRANVRVRRRAKSGQTWAKQPGEFTSVTTCFTTTKLTTNEHQTCRNCLSMSSLPLGDVGECLDEFQRCYKTTSNESNLQGVP